MTNDQTAVDSLPLRDGMFASIRREGGKFVLCIKRGGDYREETWPSRDDAWTRIADLKDRKVVAP